MAAAAVRLLQRRLTSVLCRDQSVSRLHPGLAWNSWKAVCLRNIHLPTGTADGAHDTTGNKKTCRDGPDIPAKLAETANSSVKEALSNLKSSPRHDLAMVYTCKVCETRSVKTVCRESYEKGVVVVRCGGCNNLHLIADRLGWFGEPGSVEDYLAKEEIRKGSVDTLNLTLDDLAGAGAGAGAGAIST